MKRALLSVSDKTNIIPFAQGLLERGFELISTGGTKQVLENAQLPVQGVEQLTSFPEMMDGRVKTLHPRIHGGLLAKRDNVHHMNSAKEHGIDMIDLICVNLYPFKQTMEHPSSTHQDILEQIDIGGPSMLRSAAKNYESVLVVCDPEDYGAVLTHLDHATPPRAFHCHLAGKAFGHTAAYDAHIAAYFNRVNHVAFPKELTWSATLEKNLRYGENAHQEAAFYRGNTTPCSLQQAHQLHGKELSYNNLQDAYSAIQCIQEFEEPAFVAIKHMNPCGVGFHQVKEQAWTLCYEADPVSIFGGIVATNQVINATIAQQMSKIFLEVIIAPEFEEEALQILTQKKNIRLLTLSALSDQTQIRSHYELKSLGQDYLLQAVDTCRTVAEDLQCVTKVEGDEATKKACVIAQRIVKHVKSNAIVLVKDGQCVGVGAGQMNRVGALAIALEQAKEKANGAILASDAFFPMRDSVDLACQHGIKAIVQPGGSIRDQESIDACNEHEIVMYMTDVRHFKH